MMKEKKMIPGSLCLYYKIYSSELLQTDILLMLYKLLKGRSENINFFFIRYKDPDPHLRIRYFVTDVENYTIQSKIYKLTKKLLNDKIIWKVEIDTYDREVDRYDFLGINMTENIFVKESNAICNLLLILKKHFQIVNSWYLAIWLTNMYIVSTIRKKQWLAYITLVCDAYRGEFGYDNDTKISIDKTYRRLKGTIKVILNNDRTFFPERRVLTILNNYALSYNRIIHTRAISGKNMRLFYYLQSVIHMENNRIFPNYSRMNEMMVYEMLAKYYKSLFVIENKK